MGLFDVNWGKLVSNLLPLRLRLNKMQAWLGALVSPVVYVYGLFTTNRNTNVYTLAHDSQVVYMQAVLNDAFDSTLRRITIVDGAYIDPLYTYLTAELKPVALYTTAENKPDILYTAAETATSTYDFVVNVPMAMTYDAAYMRALIDKYRLPARSSYLIQTI